jgi:aminoglycoside phosphotransferase (APT) family kinase protein
MRDAGVTQATLRMQLVAGGLSDGLAAVSDEVPLLHENQVHVDEGIVRRLVDAQFPDGRGLPLRRYPSTGTVNAIYRLGDYSVRLPLLPRSTEALHKEAAWLPVLAPQVPLAGPEVVMVGEPDDAYPLEWAIHRWIDGEPWSAAPVDDEVAAAQALADYITALQRIDTNGGPSAGRGAQGPPVRDRDRWVRASFAVTAGVLDTAAAARIWDEVLDAPDWDLPPVWVHGDLLAPNVLVREGRLHALIDYGNACVGDPAVDLAAAWSLFGPAGRRHLRSVLDADDATWTRARGWAITAIIGVAYYASSNPAFSEDCRRRVEAALTDQ